MRRRLLLASTILPAFLVGLVYGCSSEPPVEDLCAWITHDNCYLDFHKTVQNACAAPGAAGAFSNRKTLDICIISQGGSVTFDPPLDVAKFPPTAEKGMGIKMTFMNAFGMECGNVNYMGQFSFALTVNSPDGGMVGSSSSSGGGDGGVDGGMIYGGTFTATTPEGRQTLDVACPNSLETHHFDRLQVTAATGNDAIAGCPAYANIIPQAILEANPGGIKADGFVKLTLRFPPAAGVDPNAMGTVVPDDIVYFNCTIPGAPLQCENGMKDGAETAVDCGGLETSGNCPARCMMGQACLNDCDCDAATSCQVDPMDGLKKCAAGSKMGICKLICSDGVKDSNETDVDCGGFGCPPCADGKTCLVSADCQSANCANGICTMPNCMDKAKNAAETDVDCGGGTCPPCPDGKGCLSSSDCANSDCDANKLCSPCGNGQQDGVESDVDCGGSTCPKCADGKICVSPSDCASNLCVGNKCVSCSDNIKDGTESDVDCGGSCATKCAEGKTCNTAADCMFGVCAAGICNTCTDGKKDGTESDIDCGGPTCNKCVAGKSCTTNADCVNACDLGTKKCI